MFSLWFGMQWRCKWELSEWSATNEENLGHKIPNLDLQNPCMFTLGGAHILYDVLVMA